MAGEVWSDVELSEIIDVKHGFAFPGENICDEPRGDILLTPGNFAVGGGFKGDKYKYFDGHVSEEYVLHEDDLIVTMTDLSKQADTLGYPALVPKPQHFRFLHNQRLGKVLIRDATKVEKRFLSYLLRAPEYRHEVLAGATGTTVKHTSPSRILAFKTTIPPLGEQRAISRILGTLDDKIELNRRMNETLEAMARALFKSWFVDFDPVRAKVEGRDLDLPKPLADLFPDSFVDSELGEIPKGWSVGSVDDEFDLTMGQSPPGETYNDTGKGLPFYQGCTDFGFRFPTRRIYCTAPTRLGKAGDTLVSVRAPVGDINMATEECAIGRGVAAVRHKTGSRSYSYQFMQSIGEVFARFEGEGTVFGSIGKKDFHAIACVNPPPELVLAYEARVSPLDDRVEVTEREIRTLATLRDSLLPKLISGELRVKDAECIARRAV
jgi:type I restriction enzyme S subunit